MIRTVAQVAAVLILAAIVYSTLSPLGLRPQTGHLGFERATAYFLLALSLAIGFPRYFWIVVAIALVAAIGLEIVQNLTPDRHGRALDAVQKLGGAAIGFFVAYLTNRFIPF